MFLCVVILIKFERNISIEKCPFDRKISAGFIELKLQAMWTILKPSWARRFWSGLGPSALPPPVLFRNSPYTFSCYSNLLDSTHRLVEICLHRLLYAFGKLPSPP